MIPLKADIIARLKKDILPLQGFKSIVHNSPLDIGLGAINNAFPNHCFPVGAVHEFICEKREELSAAGGFITGLLAGLVRGDGVCLWISAGRKIFPPALHSYGIKPDRIIFIDLPDDRYLLWVIEEALKCNGLSAVIGEIQDIDFSASRRLQLAVEQSQVTGFILRCNPRNLSTTACLTRWKISSVPCNIDDNLPGLGFPQWEVQLLKVRNGKPGCWTISFEAGKFVDRLTSQIYNVDQQAKTG